jgi:hypothetical protein
MPYDVRNDAEFVAARATRVRIDQDRILDWARRVNPAAIQPVPRPAELNLQGGREDLARWALLLDSLNFCFWTAEGPGWETEYAGRIWRRYFALIACLRRAVDEDPAWLTPRRWAETDLAAAERLLAGRGRIPLLEERVRILNETGRVLLDTFDGKALAIPQRADYDAAGIAAVLADTFPSFRDIPSYQGRRIAILKRAQIFAADLAVALVGSTGPTVRRLESLTAFADYRIPQILRHLRILEVDAALADRIEASGLIPAAGDEEVELRACTIWAVERMVAALQAEQAASVPAWMLDEYLWLRSHDSEVRVQHHRTLTWYY